MRESGVLRRATLLSPFLTLGPLSSLAIFLLAPSPAMAKGGRRNLPVAAFSPHRITPRGNQYARLPRAFFPPSLYLSLSLFLVLFSLSLSHTHTHSRSPSRSRPLCSRTNHPPRSVLPFRTLSLLFLSLTRSLALPPSHTFSLSTTLRLGHPRRSSALRPAMPLLSSSRASALFVFIYATPYVAEERHPFTSPLPSDTRTVHVRVCPSLSFLFLSFLTSSTNLKRGCRL